MAEHRSKSLNKPDETIRFSRVTTELVELGDVTVGRISLEPGWRWSVDVRPHVGTPWCMARHVGVVVSGHFGVDFEDGSTIEYGPDDVFEIPPGHDGYCIGDEPCVQIEWSGLRTFAGYRPRNAGRSLVTLLFTDVVDSTVTARSLGDDRWRQLLSGHFEAARDAFDRHGGREIKTTGDGLLATFDGPADALSCATELTRVAAREGLHIRAGVHVGEVELVGSDVRGVAVHEAARVMGQAGADEILVSETTRALAGASGFAFEDRGTHTLKGLDGESRLYAYRPDR
ncbi:MAG: adenylate/guanylate cyclase domain-containing protein [Acidimicrobiia bacterium]